MRILFIVDPLSTPKTYEDSVSAMMHEAAARDYVIYMCLQLQFTSVSNVVETAAMSTALTDDEDDWYHTGDVHLLPLTGSGTVLMYEDPPLDMEYVTSTWLLEITERQGTRVFNKPQMIRDHSKELTIAQFREFTVPTIVPCNAKYLRGFHAEQGDVILKPLDGMGGTGVPRMEPDGLNLGTTIELFIGNGVRTIVAQRYIPAIREDDRHVLLIGGPSASCSLARVPMVGEIRDNLAADDMGRTQPLSERDQMIAHVLAPVLWQCGLLLAGPDVVEDYSTKTNIISPMHLQEIAQQTSFNVARISIDVLERAADKSSGLGRKPAWLGGTAPPPRVPHKGEVWNTAVQLRQMALIQSALHRFASQSWQGF